VGAFVIEDLALTYFQYSLLLGLFLLPGGIVAVPGGLLGQRFGSKRLASAGLAAMMVGGLVTAQTSAFATAAIGRTLIGIGGVLLNIALTKMVADWFTGREISTAMGLMLTSFPVGMAIAMACLPRLAAAYGWRAAVHVTVAAAAVGLVLVLSLYRSPAALASGESTSVAQRQSLAGWEIALSASIGLAWGLFNAGFFVLGGFAPDYLVTLGTSVANAAFIVSIGILVSLVSVPLGGVVADRLRRPNLVIVTGCLATALFIALMPLFPAPTFWFVLMGLMFGLPPGALTSLLPQALPADRLSAGLGVYYTMFYLSIVAALLLAGRVRDISHDAAAPVFFAAVVTAGSVVCLGLFRSLERRGRPHQA
jgi:MFS family permease